MSAATTVDATGELHDLFVLVHSVQGTAAMTAWATPNSADRPRGFKP